MYVVDGHDRPVPIGVVGELLIGGVGLARGYVNRPELTAERFVELDVDGTSRRVYRTGDLVRWRADGRLEFVGRVDGQVKVRGFRIELGEIEAALLADASIGGAVVIVREDGSGDKRLVACVVPADPSAEPAIADVRAGLERVLPLYMVPSGFIVLAEFPLTANGKIDRRALMQLDYTSEVRETGYVAPRTETERAVTEVWSEVLGVARIGVNDNFFHLGGHSLLATQLASRLRTRLGVDIPVRTIFTAPTPAGLADAIDGRDTGEAATTALAAATTRPAPVQRDGRPLPLSFAQQRLWFLDRLEPGNTEYLIPIELHVRGLLNLPALEAALSGILARHEALRTRFVSGPDDQPMQIVDPPGPPAVTVHNLRGATQSAARRLIETERVKPFDLTTGPLLRASVVQLADDDQYVLLTVHHIVFDGWSEAIFARELGARYAAALETDGDHEIPPVPDVQYADYAVWQRNWLTGDVLTGQLDYWRSQLTGIELLELPSDHKRPAGRGGPAGTCTFAVPAETAERARAAAAQQEASLFMVLLAVFQLLLSKYSRQEDIAVGTPIAGRNRAEIEDLVGFFVNTLVMRTDLSQDPTFAELLDRVRQAALGAYDHQDLPFERIVEELAPDRDLSRNPLFQTMFVLQNVFESGSWQLPGLEVAAQPVTLQEAKFDLTLTFSEQPDGGLLGAVEYRADLFEADTVDRLTEHFSRLLGAVLDRPGARLSQVEMLGGSERQRVLVEWNDTAVEYPQAAPVHTLIERRAAASPDIVAIRSADGAELTYAELNARANQLAHYLGAVGVGPGTLVAVCLDRSADLVVSNLGVLKAGAAYVPMDPGYPAERLAFMTEDSGALVVVTDAAHAASFPAGAPLLLVDRDGDKVDGRPATDPGVDVDITECCYVIYTSGSTGRPKGAQVEHRGMANLVLWGIRMFDLEPGDPMALSASVAFDAFAWELWLCIVAGTTCHLPTESVRLSPTALRDFYVANRVRGTFLSTPMLEAVAAVPWQSPSPVEFILTGGDLLRLPAGHDLPFRIHNVYGPTEATVMVSSTWVDPGDPVPPIGRPAANCELFVVDPHDRPVPIGVPGELLIAGVCVGRGYLNRPELTAERFARFTVDGRSHRVYRTGDLARWRADGRLEFLGRIDGQVKVRGYRVELGEIEATLLAHPDIAAATVIVREDKPGDKRLAAYVVPADPAAPPRTADLCEHLGRSLPEYMVPTAFVTLAALPLTNNGKTDRKALPVPDLNARDPRDGYTPARSPIEKAITKIWAEVLGTERIGVHDNFFHLGGHSLLATQVVSRLGRLIDTDVPVRTLFSSPTPALLAVALGELVKSAIAARFGRTDQSAAKTKVGV
ncbi:MAG TPA: amino acid adenylation domain-containing protein [Actinocrinis sp.]|nr:amino acid adenylation domain-containing protein [Actinocrinis sp.]